MSQTPAAGAAREKPIGPACARAVARPAALLVALLLPACAPEDGASTLPIAAPKPLPPLPGAPPLTTDRTITVVRGVTDIPSLNPSVPQELARMLEDGYGELGQGPGQPIMPATLDDTAPQAPGPRPKLLTRFIHLADTQLADDESPARLAIFDAPGTLGGAFRSHEGHECRILNAAVRTINAFHRSTPVDFVLLGGDNADNAQTNEVSWFMSILDGTDRVECDSGADDDPVAGPDNDPKDPFAAEGLLVPWRWVTGNHDVLRQGTLPSEAAAELAVGSTADGGTRDWSLPGAPVVQGEVVADPTRAVLTRPALLEQVAKAGDGHGIGPAEEAYGKAFYWFDVESTPVRVVVLDTAAETGGASGLLQQADVDRFIRPALDRAKSEGKWVILTSHHASRLLTDGSFRPAGIGPQPGALSVEAWQSLVGGYDNVLMHLAGHSHVHRVTKTAPPGGHAYWEIETSSLADHPHQARVIEIWDQDNGFVAIRGVALDYAVDGDPIAEDGRQRSIVDLTSGFGRDGRGEPAWRNVELWIKRPD